MLPSKRAAAMIRLLLLVLTVLCLQACGTRTVKDDSPASDLDALVQGAERNLRPTLLPNGKEYCLEDARTEAQQDTCAGDLEDALWSSNRDKERAVRDIRTGTQRIKLSRNPCGVFGRVFRSNECRVSRTQTQK